MSMKDILGKLARIDESMKSDAKKPTGPKFPGYWKGTDKASQAKNKMVGGTAEESILRDLEKALTENPKANPHVLMREFKEFKESSDEYVLYVNGKPAAKYHNVSDAEQDVMRIKSSLPQTKCEIKQEVCKLVTVPMGITEEWLAEQAMGNSAEYLEGAKKAAKLAAFYTQSDNLKSMFGVEEYIYNKMGIRSDELTESFNSKQEVIDHFVKQGKSAAAGAAAWERGWRGPKAKPTNMKDFKFKQPPVKNWQELDEYGGVGGYGAASQAPAGTTAQKPDPAADQAKADAQQIQKNTNAIATTLNQQGAAQSLNKVKFSDTMTKLDDKPNTDLNAQELKQLEPLAVATSKALQNPQTAGQMKQLIGKADTLDKQKDQKVQQAQQQAGTNLPANQQQPQSTNAPSAGQTK